MLVGDVTTAVLFMRAQNRIYGEPKTVVCDVSWMQLAATGPSTRVEVTKR